MRCLSLVPIWVNGRGADAMNDADANTDADDPRNEVRKRASGLKTGLREGPRCCGTASPCGAGIVSRRKLLLQRQRGTIKSPVEEAG